MLMYKTLNRCAISVYRTERFLEWVKSERSELYRWTLDDLNHHPNVYLSDIEDQNAWGNFFSENFCRIIVNELAEFKHPHDEDFPLEANTDSHRNWLRFEYHENIEDLSTNPLKQHEEHWDINI